VFTGDIRDQQHTQDVLRPGRWKLQDSQMGLTAGVK